MARREIVNRLLVIYSKYIEKTEEIFLGSFLHTTFQHSCECWNVVVARGFLFLRLLMRIRTATPATILFELYFALNAFFIFARPIIDPFTILARKF